MSKKLFRSKFIVLKLQKDEPVITSLKKFAKENPIGFCYSKCYFGNVESAVLKWKSFPTGKNYYQA